MKKFITIAIIAIITGLVFSSCEKEKEILDMAGTTWTAYRANGEAYLSFREDNIVKMSLTHYDGSDKDQFVLTYKYTKPQITFYENGVLIGDGTVRTETMTVDFYGVAESFLFKRGL
jgi:hypothetical protein